MHPSLSLDGIRKKGKAEVVNEEKMKEQDKVLRFLVITQYIFYFLALLFTEEKLSLYVYWSEDTIIRTDRGKVEKKLQLRSKAL